MSRGGKMACRSIKPRVGVLREAGSSVALSTWTRHLRGAPSGQLPEVVLRVGESWLRYAEVGEPD